MSGTYLECPSHDCPYKSETAIHRLFEVAGVPKGFGPKMITDFLAPIEDADIFKVIDLCHNAGWDVFRDSLQVTFGDHAGKLLVKQLENVRSLMKKGLTNEQFWFILNLKGLSWQNAKKLKKFNPIFVITRRDEFLRFKEEAKVPAPVYEAINKSGQKIARYAEVFKLIEDTTPETPKLDLVVAVTGSVCMSRGEWSKELEKLGITMGAVNKKTHYLVSNEDSNSSKSVKARELGMQVVTETEFYEILESKYNIKVPWRK
jgi:NAD-dependent DNA ligase